MTIEELAKTVSDLQTLVNTQSKTIEEMTKANETNNQTISELMKLNNELMLNVSAPVKTEEQEEKEQLVSKLLDDYSEHFDEDTLKEFINIFEEGE